MKAIMNLKFRAQGLNSETRRQLGENGHLFLEQKAKRDSMGRVQLVTAAPPELPHKFVLAWYDF